MKISLIALCVWMGIVAQSESFEKRSISLIQQIPASNLDVKLPNRPFLAWFSDAVGQEVGVVWQLVECGAPVSVPGVIGQDVPACAEANVVLPNGNRLIVDIAVGTFKRGVIGKPAFVGGVIDSGERLYPVRRLFDLPQMLREPRKFPRKLPDAQIGLSQVKPRPSAIYLSLSALGLNSTPRSLSLLGNETPPPPPRTSSRQSQICSTSVPPPGPVELVEACIIKMVSPVYPAAARSLNASGKVEVRVLISETGRVTKAIAVSGHTALRKAAVKAARQWVYRPAKRNGVPVKTESVVIFTFDPGAQ